MLEIYLRDSFIQINLKTFINNSIQILQIFSNWTQQTL